MITNIQKQHILLLAGLGLLITSCGDPLASGTYSGETLLTIEGQVWLEPGEDYLDDENVRMAIFWTGSSALGTANQITMFEQPVRTRGTFPSGLEVTLHNPPAPHLITPLEGGQGSLAIGLLLLYADDNNNKKLEYKNERIIGGSESHMIVYTPEGASGNTIEGTLGSGFHVMELVDELSRCQEEESLIFMYPVQQFDPIKFWITPLPANILPDSDCDGYEDYCHSVFEEEDHEEEEEENEEEEVCEHLNDFWECTFMMWNSEPPAEECIFLIEYSGNNLNCDLEIDSYFTEYCQNILSD